MERIYTRLEVKKAEALSQTNKLFREKVQYEELLKDTEVNIHYFRGQIAGFDEAQKIVTEIYKACQIEDKAAGRPIRMPLGKSSDQKIVRGQIEEHFANKSKEASEAPETGKSAPKEEPSK